MSLKKPEKIYEAGVGDPNAILNYRAKLIHFVYGSLDSKQQIIDDFNDKYPDCSKKSIERVFKEIIIKEKRENDLRPVWYASEQILSELPELATEEAKETLRQLSIDRMKPLIEEAERDDQKKKEDQALKDEIKRLE